VHRAFCFGDSVLGTTKKDQVSTYASVHAERALEGLKVGATSTRQREEKRAVRDLDLGVYGLGRGFGAVAPRRGFAHAV